MIINYSDDNNTKHHNYSNVCLYSQRLECLAMPTIVSDKSPGVLWAMIAKIYLKFKSCFLITSWSLLVQSHHILNCKNVFTNRNKNDHNPLLSTMVSHSVCYTLLINNTVAGHYWCLLIVVRTSGDTVGSTVVCEWSITMKEYGVTRFFSKQTINNNQQLYVENVWHGQGF